MNNPYPYELNGRKYFDKDINDKKFYVINVQKDLDDGGTSAASVEAIVSGVTVLQQAEVQGHLMIVMLEGGDPDPQIENSCTFRITCANGERFDRTIYFNLVTN